MSDWITRHVLTGVDLSTLIDRIAISTVVCFDLETQSKESNLEDWHRSSRVVSASFTLGGDSIGYVVPLSHRDGPWGHRWRQVLSALFRPVVYNQIRLMGHNLKYDARWVMSATGLDVASLLWWDTLIAAHLQDENQVKSLKVLAADAMGGDWSTEVDLSDSETQPWYPLAEYNAADTVATWRLYEQQRKWLESERGMAKLFALVAMPALRALCRAEVTGLRIDRPSIITQVEHAAVASTLAEVALMETAQTLGMDPYETYLTKTGLVRPVWPKVSWEGTAKWWREFTTRAVKEGLLEVVALTPGGAPSFDKAALAQQDTPLAREALAYRDHSKKAQFLSSWLLKADGADRLHPTFNPAKYDDGRQRGGTVTGRTSSSNPNAQQIDRRLKPCFIPADGWKFVEVDYSQIEMRMAAEFIERCPIWEGENPMMQAYLDGQDLHRLIVQASFGTPIADVTKDERQKGKALNFGFLFGMGAMGFVDYAKAAYGVDFTLPEAEESYRTYYETWQGLDYWHAYQKQTARDYGFVTNLFGRRRHLPEIHSNFRSDAAHAERQAINAPVQGSASDLMMMAMAQIDKELKDEVRLVGTVHDSVLMEVKDTAVIEAVCQIMLAPSALPQLTRPLTVPIEVEAEIGERWSDPNCDTVSYTTLNPKENT